MTAIHYPTYTVTSRDGATITGTHDLYSGGPVNFKADLGLTLIRLAWEKGCPALRVPDWSILRDAEGDEHLQHLAAALSYLEVLS